jgi:hypothetical protein
MAVFVLGAGATRGASFVDIQKNCCLPPLDNDFFTQLQRVKNAKHRDLIENVIADVIELYGHNFSTTLETVFATLDQTIKMVETTGSRRDFDINDLKAKKSRLLQAIAAVFEEALTIQGGTGSSLEMQHCECHRKLIGLMRPKEHIITFNYDCLLDHTLATHGRSKWNARYGYCFRLRGRGASLKGEDAWQPEVPADKDNSIKVYKLHGSLHFQAETENVVLKKRPYTKQQGQLKFSVIPPESNKRYDQGIFRGLWSKAGSAIHANQTLVFIGYSFPPTDLHSSALFRTSVKRNSLKSLVIVNPDRSARFRTREILKRGLRTSTKVLVYDTLDEFVTVDRTLWS